MKVKFSFPWKLYFRQLFAINTYARLINPFNFWRKYRLKHLKNCSELDLVEHLERCYQKKSQRINFYHSQTNSNCKVSGNNHQPILSKTLFIVHSSETLQYRGVEYQKPQIIGIYFDWISFNCLTNQQDCFGNNS